MAAPISHERCDHCRGRVGEYPDGRGRWGIHTLGNCPGEAANPSYRPRGVTVEDRLASYRQQYELLVGDLERHGIDGLAVRDWPHDSGGLLAAELTIRQQLDCLRWRVLRWSPSGYADELFLAITALVTAPASPAGFTAPRIPIKPTGAVGFALERLKEAGLWPLQQGDQYRADSLGRDVRLLLVWCIEREISVNDLD